VSEEMRAQASPLPLIKLKGTHFAVEAEIDNAARVSLMLDPGDNAWVFLRRR